MNLNVRFQFLRILKHPLHGNVRKETFAPSVQNDLNSYFTEKAPDSPGLFLYISLLIHGENHFVLFGHFAHVEYGIAHAPKRGVDAYPGCIGNFLKT